MQIVGFLMHWLKFSSAIGTKMTVDGKTYTLKKNVFVVGFGKAVSGMAKTLEDLIGQHIVRGVISIPYGSRELFKTHGR